MHQTYALPWPLKPRELLLKCAHEVHRSSFSVKARCSSVHTDLVPITNEAVRMEILESTWRFDALPGDRTKITVELLISEQFAVGVPSFVIDYVQKNSLKDSVRQFHRAATRLRLPAHPNFVAWRRSREELHKLKLTASGHSAANPADARDTRGVSAADFFATGVWSPAYIIAISTFIVVAGAWLLTVCQQRRKIARAWLRWQKHTHSRQEAMRCAELSRYVGKSAIGVVGAGSMPRSLSEICLPQMATGVTPSLLRVSQPGGMQHRSMSTSNLEVRGG